MKPQFERTSTQKRGRPHYKGQFEQAAHDSEGESDEGLQDQVFKRDQFKDLGAPYYGMQQEDNDEILNQRASILSGNRNEGNVRQRRVSQKDVDQRAEDMRRGKDRDYNPLLEENPEQKQFLNSFGMLKLQLGAILFLTLFLSVIGWIGYAETKFPMFTYVGSISLSMNVLWLLAIISIFKVEMDLQNIYYKNLEGSLGFEALFVFFKMTSIFLIVFFWMGISCLTNIHYYLSILESIKSSEDEWKNYYGDSSLNTIKDLTTIFSQICGFACLLTAILLLVIFNRGIQIGSTQEKNRVTAFFFTFNSVLVPAILITFLYQTVNANEEVQTIPIIGDKFLPSYAISSFIALSVVALAMTFLGFIGAVTESKAVIEAYSFILFVVMIVMFGSSLLLRIYSQTYDSFFATNWGDLMVYLHKDYFNQEFMGCYGGKYRNNQASVNYFDLKCKSKDEIAYMWEGQYDKNLADQVQNYGCLNMGCKDVFGYLFHQKINNLFTIGYTCGAVLAVTLILILNIWRKLSNAAVRIFWHSKVFESVFMTASIAIIILGGVSCIFFRSTAPVIFKYGSIQPPELIMDATHLQIGMIKADLLVPNQDRFKIHGIQISEDQTQCHPDCTPLVYNVTLSTDKGDLELQKIYTTLEYGRQNGWDKNKKKYTVSFWGYLNDVNKQLASVYYGPQCPFLPDQKINLRLTAWGKNGEEASGQKVSVTSGQAQDVKGTGQTLIIDDDVKQTYIKLDANGEKVTVRVKGRVIDMETSTPLQDSSVVLSYFTDACPTKEMKTDSFGEFYFDAPQMTNSLPYQLSVKASKADYVTGQRLVQIGGLVHMNEHIMQVKILKTSTKIQSYYQARLLDDISFDAVTTRPEVSLYQGGNMTKLEDQKALATIQTPSSGVISFSNATTIGQGLIHVKDFSSAYMSYFEPVYIVGDQAQSNNIQRDIFLNRATDNSYDVRFVLTWTSPTATKKVGNLTQDYKSLDLDLFVDFKVNPNYICSVGFYMPQCQGVSTNYESVNTNQNVTAETTQINTIGNYTYLIYVSQYLDKQAFKPEMIQNSNAKIDMYMRNQNSGPISTFWIPYENEGKDVDEEGKQFKYWAVACYRGEASDKVFVLNQLSNNKPDASICNKFY